MSNATAASIYKWMKKKNGKTKARITIGKGRGSFMAGKRQVS
jgi:hypothetical protein